MPLQRKLHTSLSRLNDLRCCSQKYWTFHLPWVLKTFNILEEEFYLMHLLRFLFVYLRQDYLNSLFHPIQYSKEALPAKFVKKSLNHFLHTLLTCRRPQLFTLLLFYLYFIIAFLAILPIYTFITLQTFIHALLLSESWLWTCFQANLHHLLKLTKYTSRMRQNTVTLALTILCHWLQKLCARLTDQKPSEVWSSKFIQEHHINTVS